jgi:hypothetical protein
MTRITKRLVFAVIVIAFFSKVVPAATYTAASCNESDVQAAYTTEQASAQDGDIIAIPAGTCTWTTTLALGSPTNSLTIQGAGALVPSTSCTFAPGSACLTTSGSDQTVLVDDVASMLTVTIPGGKTFRITGLEVDLPNGNPTNASGAWYITSSGTQAATLRIDHCHFYGYQDHWIAVLGWIYGVADHNLIDQFARPGPGIWIDIDNGSNWNNAEPAATPLYGNASWADSSYWGSDKFFFEENNVFPADQTSVGTYMNDCSRGGRQVFRYNTMEGTAVVQAHEALQDARGCRATEFYGNTDTATTSGNPIGTRSGSDLVWGNVGHWPSILNILVDRTSNLNGIFSNPPPNGTSLSLCGQGASGTATSSGSTVTWVSGRNGNGTQVAFRTNWPDVSTPNMFLNGTSYPIASCPTTTSCTLTGLTGSNATPVPWYAPSVWDQNTDSTGYACYDQPGRGKGDLITGTFIGKSVTGASWSSGTATLTVSGTNTFTSGYINVFQVSPSGYNGTFAITGSTTSSVSYALASNPGTYVSGGAIDSRVDNITHTPTWPNEQIDPSYVFDNSNSQMANNILSIDPFTGAVEQSNRDWYADQWTPTVQGSGSCSSSPTTCPFDGSNVSQPISSWTANGTSLTLTVPSASGFSAGQHININGAATGTGGRVINETYVVSSVTPTTIVVPYGFSDSSSTSQGYVSSLGVGVGTLANRPTTCGAGPGGNTPGVGYFATDQGSQGVLYVCNPTNTWTAYYTPYTYPHPLTQVTGGSVNPPTNLAATAQ